MQPNGDISLIDILKVLRELKLIDAHEHVKLFGNMAFWSKVDDFNGRYGNAVHK